MAAGAQMLPRRMKSANRSSALIACCGKWGLRRNYYYYCAVLCYQPDTTSLTLMLYVPE